jgi:hypothetical protein
MKLYRAESLNDSPLFIRAVADLVQARLNAAATDCKNALPAEKIS